GDWLNRPLLLSLTHIVAHPNVNITRRLFRRNLRDILCRDRFACAREHPAPTRRAWVTARRACCATGPCWRRAPSPGAASHGEPPYGKPKDHALNDRFKLISTTLQVFTGDRPTVFPLQRADVEHAGPTPVQVGFIVK